MKIKNNYDHLYKKVNKHSKKLSLLVKIIDELNNNLEDSSEGYWIIKTFLLLKHLKFYHACIHGQLNK